MGIIVKGRLVLSGSMQEIRARAADESLEEIFLSVAGGEKFEIAEKPDAETKDVSGAI